MRVLTISNQKGGVAKTTTVISLASALAERGLGVLVCDLDPQANLTMGLGREPVEIARGMFQLLTGQASAEEVVLRAVSPGVDLVPADLTLAGAERRLLGEIGFDEILRARLQRIADSGARYDVCLVDSPPSLGLLTINAITAAECVIVPVQCEYFSARGLGQLLEVTDLVRAKRCPDLRVLVLPTLYDQRNRVCREILQELQSEFGDDAFRQAIGIDTRLRECAAAGQPIVHFAPRSRAAAQYRAVAEELGERGYVPRGDARPAPRRPRRPARKRSRGKGTSRSRPKPASTARRRRAPGAGKRAQA